MPTPATRHLTLREMPESERPREKLERLGASALSDAELLAIILRVGGRGKTATTVASDLLTEFNGLPGLARLPLATLRTAGFVGLAKGAQILAALEMGRRACFADPAAQGSVRSPLEVASLIRSRPRYRSDQEQLWAVSVDSRNHVLDARCIYEGSASSVQVRPGEVFRQALALNAIAVIIAHTHPSGDPSPSADDVEVTRQLVDAGKALEIRVLDHLVLGAGNVFVSLKERGVAFA